MDLCSFKIKTCAQLKVSLLRQRQKHDFQFFKSSIEAHGKSESKAVWAILSLKIALNCTADLRGMGLGHCAVGSVMDS